MSKKYWGWIYFISILFISACDNQKSGDALDSKQYAEKTQVVKGNLSYRERIALPPNSIAKIQISDISIADKKAEIIAETTINLAGSQVPIPFSLKVNTNLYQFSHHYALRATIETKDGLLLWTTDTNHMVKTDEMQLDLGRLAMVKVNPSELASTISNSLLYYQCGDLSVSTQNLKDKLEINIDDNKYYLSRVIAASGEKYQSDEEGLPNISFWTHQQNAKLMIEGEDYPECRRLNPLEAAGTIKNKEWRVSYINNNEVIDNVPMTINFSESRIFGSMGCNTYSAEYQLTQGQLQLGVLAVTKKACLTEVALQESQFLNLLNTINFIKLDKNNNLILQNETGGSILAN